MILHASLDIALHVRADILQEGMPVDGQRGRSRRAAASAAPGFAFLPGAGGSNGDPEKKGGTSTAVLEAEEVDAKPGRAWTVILYNDDVHTFEEVEFQLQKAIGCSLEVAGWLAWQTHLHGRQAVFGGEKEACERVAGILRQIALQVELDQA